MGSLVQGNSQPFGSCESEKRWGVGVCAGYDARRLLGVLLRRVRQDDLLDQNFVPGVPLGELLLSELMRELVLVQVLNSYVL